MVHSFYFAFTLAQVVNLIYLYTVLRNEPPTQPQKLPTMASLFSPFRVVCSALATAEFCEIAGWPTGEFTGAYLYREAADRADEYLELEYDAPVDAWTFRSKMIGQSAPTERRLLSPEDALQALDKQLQNWGCL